MVLTVCLKAYSDTNRLPTSDPRLRNEFALSKCRSLHRQLSHPRKGYVSGYPQHVECLQILLQRRSTKLRRTQADVKQCWLHATLVADFAVPILTFLRQHLCQRRHHVKMQPVHLVVEALRVQGSLRSEDRHGVIDVICFLGRDASEGIAETPRSHFPDSRIACDGK